MRGEITIRVLPPLPCPVLSRRSALRAECGGARGGPAREHDCVIHFETAADGDRAGHLGLEFPTDQPGDGFADEDFADLTPIDDVRATALYRRDAARELVARALRDAWEAAHA